MSFPLPSPPPAPLVLDDTPCRSCGYNLRTLPTTGICPECTTPVARSLAGHLLRDADPHFLRRLNAGLRISQFSIGGLLLIAFLDRGVWRFLFSAAPIFSLIGSAAALAGTWLLTTPDPSGLGEDQYGSLRTTARVLGVLQFVAFFFMTICFTAAPGIYFPSEFAAFIAQFVWGIYLLLYLRGLVKRTLSIAIIVTLTWQILAYVGVLLLVTISTYLMTRNVRSFALIPNEYRFIAIFLFSGLITFSGALNPELHVARAPRRLARTTRIPEYLSRRPTRIYCAALFFRKKQK